jgi:hypothetical protein
MIALKNEEQQKTLMMNRAVQPIGKDAGNKLSNRKGTPWWKTDIFGNGVLLATGTDENRKNAKFAASKYAAWKVKIEMGLD